ncbi:hypothetical protein [Pleionea sp. CnH1-48]|uniref:hypothetical protein n=1 Tax=Pleionea sp. CnH1-48 TaxID=2954494 RepID=UPI002097B155|nr:hypothetical protein [Pleionea sp. CnH1-48]MCO7223316.1 hypothetical protein [Pleionea sp. CnH1-48]
MTEPARAQDAPNNTTAPPTPNRAPEPNNAAPTADGEAGNQAVMGLQEDGSYKIQLGNGIHIAARLFNRRTADLENENLTIPGVKFKSFRKDQGRRPGGRLTAELTLPKVEENEFTININAEGEVRSLRNARNIDLDFPALNNPRITELAFTEDKQLAGTLNIRTNTMRPRGSNMTITGEGNVSIRGGNFSGSFTANMTYPDLADGSFTVRFSESGDVTGEGNVNLTHSLLEGVTGTLALEENNLTTTVAIPVTRLNPRIPGLSLTSGTVNLRAVNRDISGGLEAVTFDYKDFANGSVSANIANGRLSGNGTFNSSLSALSDVSGTIGYRNNQFSGSITVNSSDFPETLPIRSGSITGTIDNEGRLGFSGSMVAALGPVGEGTFSASMDAEGNTSIAAEVDLAIPGLQGARFRVALVNGELEGEGDVPINTEVLQGVSGNVHIEYKNNLWSGETTFSFEADNGRLSGSVTVGVRQNEEGGLNVYGGGQLTMQLSDNITGTVGAEISPEGQVTLNMRIDVAPIELFPERRVERELFRHSQNIPLWAILVAVIRMRAGVRAGIGPGQFRDISVTGTYTIGDPEGPDLEFTGELFIPAFAEGYVAFGAGLGLDVVLGSLTGGIEGVATAGIYGAVSVRPLLEYDNGDWAISGTATMAAGARFKLGLNAWAEVEAFWVTVWENTWNLAEKTWNIGPNLAVQFQLQRYVLGSGETPEVTMETGDMPGIDSMIQDAMPKDDPAPAGGRQAMQQQRGQWRGRRQGEGRQQSPPASQQQQAARPPQADPQAAPPERAPQRPGRRPPPPPGAARGQQGARPGSSNRGGGRAQGNTANSPNRRGAPGASPGTNRQPGAQGSGQPGSPNAQQNRRQPGDPTASASEVPNSDQPRHPASITLRMLDEPPVPTPRTADQKRADLRAAKQVLDLAAAQSPRGYDQLDDYYGRIQRRFRLTDISLVPEGSGYKVNLSINPNLRATLPDVKASGTGIAGKTTNIVHRSTNLGGSPVGVEMTANWLGPDHPVGSDSTSGKQSTLMNKLETDPGRNNNQKYIRGHLLNAQVGGPARDVNLFPITAEANELHKTTVETRVKDWVNTQRLWVYYKVKVIAPSGDRVLTNPSTPVSKKRQNYVNATFQCHAYQRYMNGRRKGEEIKVDIHSRYRIPSAPAGTPTFDRDDNFDVQTDLRAGRDRRGTSAVVAPTARSQDLAATIVPVGGSGPVFIDSSLRSRIASRLAAGVSWAAIRAKLKEFTFVGDSAVDALRAAYGAGAAGYNGTDKGQLTRLNNLYLSDKRNFDLKIARLRP